MDFNSSLLSPSSSLLLTSSASCSDSSTSPSRLSQGATEHASFTKSKKRNAGRKKFKVTRHPIYRGVRQRNTNKWVCEVREPNKKTRLWLGTYPYPEMAARAHDVAALALKGSSAELNFPESPLLLPRAKSTSPEDIRVAVAHAAQITSCNGREVNQGNNIGVREMGREVWNEYDHKDAASMFLDEEALFNMPCFLDSMAEGLILTPLAMQRGFSWDDTITCDHVDCTLW